MTLPWHLYLMGFVYIIAGLNHFRIPKLYTKIIPPYFKNPGVLNKISGFAEIILGILLCFPLTTAVASWGIIALLIAVFPANIYMYQNDNAGLGMPKWIRLLRLPLQFGLILWAYQYTYY